MGTVNKTARAFDDDLEEFELRIRVEPIRNPEALGAKKPRVNNRIEVEMRGIVVYSDDPEARHTQVVSWQKANGKNFSGPRWGAKDLQALKTLLAKFHAEWKEQVDG